MRSPDLTLITLATVHALTAHITGRTTFVHSSQDARLLAGLAALSMGTLTAWSLVPR